MASMLSSIHSTAWLRRLSGNLATATLCVVSFMSTGSWGTGTAIGCCGCEYTKLPIPGCMCMVGNALGAYCGMLLAPKRPPGTTTGIGVCPLGTMALDPAMDVIGAGAYRGGLSRRLRHTRTGWMKARRSELVATATTRRTQTRTRTRSDFKNGSMNESIN